VLGQCEVEATRRALSEARESAYGDNLELVAQGIGLRKEIATLLGYPSWAHYVIETRMAGTPEAVSAFMAKVATLAQAGSERDVAQLRDAKIEHLKARGELPEGGEAEVRLQAWDSSFYSNYILKRDHGVDTEAVRAYFPLEHVVGTTMAIYQELLGLRFTELPAGSFPRWHAEVRLFVVHDVSDGSRVGHFYLDLHPREGKYAEITAG
jgi:Zn-dependent oligopeptidase